MAASFTGATSCSIGGTRSVAEGALLVLGSSALLGSSVALASLLAGPSSSAGWQPPGDWPPASHPPPPPPRLLASICCLHPGGCTCAAGSCGNRRAALSLLPLAEVLAVPSASRAFSAFFFLKENLLNLKDFLKEMFQDSSTERQDTKAFCQEAVFIHVSTGSVDSYPEAEPQTQWDSVLYALHYFFLYTLFPLFPL